MPTAFLNLWARRARDIDVKPGCRYFRRRRDDVTELATVMDLKPDAFGIPHVRFALVFEKPSIGRVEAGLRMLALNAFVSAYRQRLS